MQGVCRCVNFAFPICFLVKTVMAPVVLVIGVCRSAIAMPIMGPPSTTFADFWVTPPQNSISSATGVPMAT